MWQKAKVITGPCKQILCQSVFKTHLWVREMAQQLRAFVALVEDLSSIPSTNMMVSQLSVIPVPEDPMTSSDFKRHQAHP